MPPERRSMEIVDEVRLVNAKELMALFPDARLLREKAFGLTKSYVVVRRP